MEILDSGISNYVRINNSKYSFFAGNNYLGLANHPTIVNDAAKALEHYGINFSGSRQTTGTSNLHLELEKRLSIFKNKDDSVAFASGYFGNRILLHALKDRYSALFIDESAHPSFTDGIPFDISAVYFYRHCDPTDLENLLKKNRKLKPLILTDGIFPLTGEITPLDKLHPLAIQYNAAIIIDDAHATGILGANGRGTPEHFNLDNAPDIYQSETMSKALGAYGGFIAAGENLIKNIRNRSTLYCASTSLPAVLAAAGCSSLNIVKNKPELRTMVIQNAQKIRVGIKNLGFMTTPDPTPIIPVLFSLQEKAKNLSRYLKENNIIVPVVDYPVKKDHYILRITVSAIHTMDQIEELLYILKKWRDSHGLNKN